MKNRINELKKKFPCVYAWGKMMESFDYYIERQLEKAEETNAPANAIYERDGVWSIADEIKDPVLKVQILNYKG